jgi:hypothetical protein
MLSNIQGKLMQGVPHAKDFERVLRLLGPERADAARAHLNQIIDEMAPSPGTGVRVFSSSHLGSNLSPWTCGLKHLYDVACEELGESAEDRDIEARAALIFGLFVWECIVNRGENWVFYDPNLSSRDPNREIIGKTYFEQPD